MVSLDIQDLVGPPIIGVLEILPKEKIFPKFLGAINENKSGGSGKAKNCE